MDDEHEDYTPVDMAEVNRLVSKQNFTGLQKLIVDTNNVGSDIVLLLAMCTLLHNEMKALREKVQEMKNTSPTGFITRYQ